MGEMSKAIMAVLGGIAMLVAQFTGIEVSPAIITAVGTVITTILVYAVPNKSA